MSSRKSSKPLELLQEWSETMQKNEAQLLQKKKSVKQKQASRKKGGGRAALKAALFPKSPEASPARGSSPSPRRAAEEDDEENSGEAENRGNLFSLLPETLSPGRSPEKPEPIGVPPLNLGSRSPGKALSPSPPTTNRSMSSSTCDSSHRRFGPPLRYPSQSFPKSPGADSGSKAKAGRGLLGALSDEEDAADLARHRLPVSSPSRAPSTHSAGQRSGQATPAGSPSKQPLAPAQQGPGVTSPTGSACHSSAARPAAGTPAASQQEAAAARQGVRASVSSSPSKLALEEAPVTTLGQPSPVGAGDFRISAVKLPLPEGGGRTVLSGGSTPAIEEGGAEGAQTTGRSEEDEFFSVPPSRTGSQGVGPNSGFGTPGGTPTAAAAAAALQQRLGQVEAAGGQAEGPAKAESTPAGAAPQQQLGAGSPGEGGPQLSHRSPARAEEEDEEVEHQALLEGRPSKSPGSRSPGLLRMLSGAAGSAASSPSPLGRRLLSALGWGGKASPLASPAAPSATAAATAAEGEGSTGQALAAVDVEQHQQQQQPEQAQQPRQAAGAAVAAAPAELAAQPSMPSLPSNPFDMMGEDSASGADGTTCSSKACGGGGGASSALTQQCTSPVAAAGPLRPSPGGASPLAAQSQTSRRSSSCGGGGGGGGDALRTSVASSGAPANSSPVSRGMSRENPLYEPAGRPSSGGAQAWELHGAADSLQGAPADSMVLQGSVTALATASLSLELAAGAQAPGSAGSFALGRHQPLETVVEQDDEGMSSPDVEPRPRRATAQRGTPGASLALLEEQAEAWAQPLKCKWSAPIQLPSLVAEDEQEGLLEDDEDDLDEPLATARELVNNDDWPTGEAKGGSPIKGADASSGEAAKAAGKQPSGAGSSKGKSEAKSAAEVALGPLEEAMRLSQLQRLQQQREGGLLGSSVSTVGGSSAVFRSSPFDGRLPSGRGSGSNTARSGLSSVEAEVDEAYTMPLQFSLLHSNLSGDQQQLQAAAAGAAAAAGTASPWGSFGWSSDGPGGLDHRDVPLSMQASSPNRVATRSSRLGRHTSAPPAVPASSMGGLPSELQPGRSISLRAMAGSSAQASTLCFQPSGSMQAAGPDVAAAGGWGFAALPAAGSSPTRSGVFASQQRQRYTRSQSAGARAADSALAATLRFAAQHGLSPRQAQVAASLAPVQEAADVRPNPSSASPAASGSPGAAADPAYSDTAGSPDLLEPAMSRRDTSPGTRECRDRMEQQGKVLASLYLRRQLSDEERRSGRRSSSGGGAGQRLHPHQGSLLVQQALQQHWRQQLQEEEGEGEEGLAAASLTRKSPSSSAQGPAEPSQAADSASYHTAHATPHRQRPEQQEQPTPASRAPRRLSASPQTAPGTGRRAVSGGETYTTGDIASLRYSTPQSLILSCDGSAAAETPLATISRLRADMAASSGSEAWPDQQQHLQSILHRLESRVRDSRVRAKSEAQRRAELEQMVQALQAQVNNLTAEADQASLLKQQLLGMQGELQQVREENERLARQRQQMKDQLQVASRLRGSNLHPAAMQQQLQQQEALLQSYPMAGAAAAGLPLGAFSMAGNPMHSYPQLHQAEMEPPQMPGPQLRGLGAGDVYGNAGVQQQQQLRIGQQAQQREEEVGLWQGGGGGDEEVHFVPPSPGPGPAAVHMAGAYPAPFEDEGCLHHTISPPSAPHATMSRLDSAWGAAGNRRCGGSSRSAAAPTGGRGAAAAVGAAVPAMAAPPPASGRLPPQQTPPLVAHGYPPPAPAAQLAGSMAGPMPTPPLAGSVAASMHGGQRQTAADMLPRGLLDSMQVPPSAVPSGATLSDYGSGGSAQWANPNYSGPSSSSFSDPATELWHSMQPPPHQQQRQSTYAQQQQHQNQQQRYPYPSTAPQAPQAPQAHRHPHHRRQPSAPPGSAPAAAPLAGHWGRSEGPLTAMYPMDAPGLYAYGDQPPRGSTWDPCTTPHGRDLHHLLRLAGDSSMFRPLYTGAQQMRMQQSPRSMYDTM